MMSLVIVSKIACQRMFQLSDRSVPRTFVEDCICMTRSDNDMLSGQSVMALPLAAEINVSRASIFPGL